MSRLGVAVVDRMTVVELRAMATGLRGDHASESDSRAVAFAKRWRGMEARVLERKPAFFSSTLLVAFLCVKHFHHERSTYQ